MLHHEFSQSMRKDVSSVCDIGCEEIHYCYVAKIFIDVFMKISV
jgi:hypothetical protein